MKINLFYCKTTIEIYEKIKVDIQFTKIYFNTYIT